MTRVVAGERPDPQAPVRLDASHCLDRFRSGRTELDDWLRDHALASEGRTARTYVVCEGADVVGYYCIATGSIERGALPSRLRRQRGLPGKIPVAIIGRLARDIRYRGTGLGRDLLQDAITRIVAASQTIGLRAILVQALDEEAARFWKAQDFIESPLGSRIFHLSIEAAIEALDAAGS